MNNSTSSQNYRKSKLEEIKKINDLNVIDEFQKKSLIRKALKDALSDPKIQEAQAERKNHRVVNISSEKNIKNFKAEIERLEKERKLNEEEIRSLRSKDNQLYNEICRQKSLIDREKIRLEFITNYSSSFKEIVAQLDSDDSYMKKYNYSGVYASTSPSKFDSSIYKAELILDICEKKSLSDYQILKEKIKEMKQKVAKYRYDYTV